MRAHGLGSNHRSACEIEIANATLQLSVSAPSTTRVELTERRKRKEGGKVKMTIDMAGVVFSVGGVTPIMLYYHPQLGTICR